MSSRFTAAVIQSAPVVFEPNATLAKVRDLTADASKQGAKLEGRDDFRKYFDSAIDVPGRATQELSWPAKESGVYLVIGVIERDIVVGHYARPDVFQVHLNEKPAPPVIVD
jgi:nitrilase